MQIEKFEKLIFFLTRSRIRLHLLFWFCVIGGYILVQPALPEKYGWKIFIFMLFIKFLLVVAMVYINLYGLIPLFIYKKKKVFLYILVFLLNNLLFAVLLYFADDAFMQSVIKPGDEIRSSSDKIYYFITQFVSNFWYLGSTTALKFTKQHFYQQIELNKIEITKLQTEVKYLIAQINPHFLFNAINTIYVQIDRQNKNARETITKFSEMLRYQLYECNVPAVSLAKEIDYIQNYVDIQRLRKSERHRVAFNYPSHTEDIYLPPLLFIGFVENAFKFISNDKHRDNFVLIDMKIQEKKLSFRVENTILSNGNITNQSVTGGIGLRNIKRRLELQ